MHFSFFLQLVFCALQFYLQLYWFVDHFSFFYNCIGLLCTSVFLIIVLVYWALQFCTGLCSSIVFLLQLAECGRKHKDRGGTERVCAWGGLKGKFYSNWCTVCFLVCLCVNSYCFLGVVFNQYYT